MRTVSDDGQKIMDPLSQRALTSQLSEDLGWLEQHSLSRGIAGRVGTVEHALQTGELRLAAGLIRNCLGPMLNNQPPTPLHIAVVGGAGAGKSTVTNLLTGHVSAEANPQAGFTRHPIVYTMQGGALNWAGHAAFLGTLQRAPQPGPSSVDADIYQVRRVPADPSGYNLLMEFAVWDCPDMTTWAAVGGSGPNSLGYVGRVLEVASLADIIVYVASDERYNDEVPTQFLHLLLQTGKPVICCLTKMRPQEADALVAHFQKDVLSRLPPGVVATIAIPGLTLEQRSDLVKNAAKYRIPLLNQVAVLASSPARLRRRTAMTALTYLQRSLDRLLAVARDDINALEGWRAAVYAGQTEFEERYRREYLTSEKYRGFDAALVQLIDLLDFPGVGKLVSGTLWVLRTPYRLLRTAIGKAFSRPTGIGMPELSVLEQGVAGWIDTLRREAAQKSSTHPLWAHVARGFSSENLADQIRANFQQGFRNYQMALSQETDRNARAIYEQLEKNPVLLNTMRGSKLAMDVAAISTALVAGGINPWDILLVPLAASATHQLVELMGATYVNNQRESARQAQMGLMQTQIAQPVGTWLANWPATGGSTFERLQLALRRVPEALQQLRQWIEARP